MRILFIEKIVFFYSFLFKKDIPAFNLKRETPTYLFLNGIEDLFCLEVQMHVLGGEFLVHRADQFGSLLENILVSSVQSA